MKVSNKLTRGTYRKLVWMELLFGRTINFLMLLFYTLAFRVLYFIAKVGQLRKNAPMLFLFCLVLLGMIIEVFISYHRAMKNKIYYGQESVISIENNGLGIINGQEEILYSWDKIMKIQENKSWYYIYMKENIFLPLSKRVISMEEKDQIEKYFSSHKIIKRTYQQWIIVSLFVVITILGGYKIGTTAVNFNGALSWKLLELKTDKKIKLKDKNFYSTSLEGILKEVSDKVKFQPNLMTNSLEINFEPDGTIKSIDTYIYGFDENYKLVDGYLLYYDKNKSSKLTIHVQDWGNGGTMKYNEDNDLKILITMLKRIPIKEEVSKWGQNQYGILYRGVRSFGYNLEGIRYIDKKGNIIIPEVPREEVIGPTVSVYSPGNENIIIPHRFVYKEEINIK